MIENIEQLIKVANKIEDQTERLSFVMNYFLKSVEYDYSYLLIKGYLQETISEIAPFSDEDLIPNPFKKGRITLKVNNEDKEFDDSICTTTRISKGKSEMLEKIDELTHNSNGDLKQFFGQLRNVLYTELIKHLNNEEIVNENIERTIDNIQKSMGAGRIIGEYFVGKDIKSILIDYLLEPNKYMPPIIENGLLKRGVCQHYADYLEEVLPKMGIVAKRVDGTSEMGHAWIAAMVDGELKSVDLTRAIFIRDHFAGIPSNQKSSDWLISSFGDAFKMQNTRTVTSVGIDENGKDIPLPYVMNSQNFDEQIIINLLSSEKTKPY